MQPIRRMAYKSGLLNRTPRKVFEKKVITQPKLDYEDLFNL